VIGVFLLACVGVGVFVFNRRTQNHPVRYASSVTIRVAPAPPTPKDATKKTPTTTAPLLVLSSAAKTALLPSTTDAALAASNLPPGDAPKISFHANPNATADLLTLQVSAPYGVEATSVAKNWGDQFIVARKKDVTKAITQAQRQLYYRTTQLHSQLVAVDQKLAKLLPDQYGKATSFDQQFGATSRGGAAGGGGGAGDAASGQPPPPIPEGSKVSVYLINKAYERINLIDQLTQTSQKRAQVEATVATPQQFGQILGQTPAARLSNAESARNPALIALLIGLLIALAAAVLVDFSDRTIRYPEQAAAAFSAPVLSVIPWISREVASPHSSIGEAYRGLAALSIATDRLPTAIMVSAPTGGAYEEVAANFAVALSSLGVKVALIATSSHQNWYLKSLARPADGQTTLPELLTRAHSGTLNGELIAELQSTDNKTPNLVVVPPAAGPMAQLPIDGLPPLLEAISEMGVDVTVIAGPPFLEAADATIIAWATRSVMWAISPGEITRADARAATARLELAGVTSFGVVMVGANSNGS
jgi:Mrp family chromosome partitioning ATPase